MKVIFSLSLIICIAFTFPYNEEVSDYAFFYEIDFSSDSLNPEDKSKDLMVLFTVNGKSRFQSYYGFQRDSLAEIAKDQGMSVNDVIPFVNQIQKPQFYYIITKDWNKNSYKYVDRVYPDYLIFEDQLAKIEWTIENEFDEHMGFKTQKAITSYGGRDYEAWFAEEIPINDGPYIFGNLPGLIVKLKDTRNHYNFKLTKVENKSVNVDYVTHRKTITSTKSQFHKAQHDFNANVVGRMAMGGVTLTDKNQAKDIQEGYNKKNNPLELDVLAAAGHISS